MMKSFLNKKRKNEKKPSMAFTLKIPDGPDSGPADPIRVQVLCADFEKVWKLPEASRTSPRVFLRVVRIVRIPEQLSDLEKSTYFAR